MIENLKYLPSLSLKDYSKLISSMPIDNHAFTINKSSWSKDNDNEYIEQVLSQNSDSLIINRRNLRATGPIDEFIIHTLMWGYPTKGRGNNINKLLEIDNYTLLQKTLSSYRKEKAITTDRLIKDLQLIKSCGISTMSKFLCFLAIKVDGFPSIILDRQIIRVLQNGTFTELDSLTHLTYSNGYRQYGNYLKMISDVSSDISVTPEKLEMFLFVFGRNLG